MKYGIKLYGAPGGQPIEPPEWLESFDPDAHAPDKPYPTGAVTSTSDSEKAMQFDGFVEAAELWKLESKAVPVRPDGLPNRPLTAFTVEISPLPEPSE